MKTNLLNIMAAAMTAGCLFATTSCSSKPDNDEITQQSLLNYFNVITDTQTGAATIDEGVSYMVEYNYANATAVVELSGLALPDANAYPTIKTQAVKWTVDNNGWKNINAAAVMTSATNYGAAPVLNDFRFNLMDRWVSDDLYAAYTRISFSIDDRWTVRSYPKNYPAFSNTTSTAQGSSYEYSTTESVYVLDIEPRIFSADLAINEFQLSDDIKVIAVGIKDLPMSLGADGTIVVKAPTATAKIVGDAEADKHAMAVTDLDLTFDGDRVKGSYNICYEGTNYAVSLK